MHWLRLRIDVLGRAKWIADRGRGMGMDESDGPEPQA